MFSYLLSLFTKETAIEIRLVEVGTGQALKIGEHGDCDVVFIRGNPAALAFVEHGFACFVGRGLPGRGDPRDSAKLCNRWYDVNLAGSGASFPYRLALAEVG